MVIHEVPLKALPMEGLCATAVTSTMTIRPMCVLWVGWSEAAQGGTLGEVRTRSTLVQCCTPLMTVQLVRVLGGGRQGDNP